MNKSIVLLPGDGIGPEVLAQGRNILEAVAKRFGHEFTIDERPMGGNAIDMFGDPLPQSTLDACRGADAVILGAIGGPKWDDPNAKTRPEAGLLDLRKGLGLYANLRPILPHPQLVAASPLRPDLIAGVDILFFRELTGGIYFGPSAVSSDGNTAQSDMVYHTYEIERIVRLAAQAARERSNHLTSVDKANVLEVSRLWRKVAARVMEDEYPDVEYDVVLVDAMAMHLISRPATFDVVVTGNLFGDILTDEASMLPGSLGMLPSAAIGDDGPGLYEPIHGSAPDIAGKGIANPLATILAVAMALRHSLDLLTEADAVEEAVGTVLDAGLRTPDIAVVGEPTVSTSVMGNAVSKALTSAAT
ncbi:MAG: 3-isopropylmalate dehydrogenase [Acidobacteria bacterium]|nr:3-isopropylmalate dehydrogenase [Acidobacteriota bacterium]MCH8985303.1 3-isopropylmalate dehydrogenase [Acidobacteriota bacterium]